VSSIHSFNMSSLKFKKLEELFKLGGLDSFFQSKFTQILRN